MQVDWNKVYVPSYMVSFQGSNGSKKEKPLAQGRLNETNALSS